MMEMDAYFKYTQERTNTYRASVLGKFAEVSIFWNGQMMGIEEFIASLNEDLSPKNRNQMMGMVLTKARMFILELESGKSEREVRRLQSHILNTYIRFLMVFLDDQDLLAGPK